MIGGDKATIELFANEMVLATKAMVAIESKK
jgi:hypothetical protein